MYGIIKGIISLVTENDLGIWLSQENTEIVHFTEIIGQRLEEGYVRLETWEGGHDNVYERALLTCMQKHSHQ